jgi:prephenate dehydrogenase
MTPEAPDGPLKCNKVAILGVGLIGGSLGLALRGSGFAGEVAGWDIDEAVSNAGLQRGALDAVSGNPEDAVQDADLIILAVPISATIPLLMTVVPFLTDDAVVTDVGGTKARIVREAEAIIGGRFVGGHPMAGSEVSGISAASADLFEGAAWIITLTEETRRNNFNVVEEIVRTIKAIPRTCTPEEHDALVASLSHLPHLLAYGLTQTVSDSVPAEWGDLAAGSFRDGTRVAKSNPKAWAEILLDNRDSVLKALDQNITWTAKARAALESGDLSSLTQLLEQAHLARKRFPG